MQENLHRVGIGVTALALRCYMKKVVIVNDNDGLRRITCYPQFTYAFALRLTEERLTEDSPTVHSDES